MISDACSIHEQKYLEQRVVAITPLQRFSVTTSPASPGSTVNGRLAIPGPAMRYRRSLYRADRALMRSRLQAGLDRLRAEPDVDESRVAVMGFCFGGGCALELARSGADVQAVVSFHGNLDTPNPADGANIRGSVLVLHGADDPSVSAEQKAAFEEEMRNAGVDWEMIVYGNAVHSFTQPGAGNDNSKGVAYNEKAAKRSWQAMLDFLGEIFSQ